MSTKLFVGNLSFNTTENDLQDAFAAHGTVVEANLMMDRMTGKPRGFGFITMSTPEEAQKAIDSLNGAELDGRALTVNIARPREERSGGGGGGRREFGGGRGGGGGGGGGRTRYSEFVCYYLARFGETRPRFFHFCAAVLCCLPRPVSRVRHNPAKLGVLVIMKHETGRLARTNKRG
jgi:cold-inducible RNA-binding protein